MNKPPEFTDEQRDYICYMIGEWYLRWKNKITDNDNPHRLGIAKEQLKEFIFPAIRTNFMESVISDDEYRKLYPGNDYQL